MSIQKGINILGYINKQFGLGEAARCNIRSIKAVQIPFFINDFKGKISSDILDDKMSGFPLSEENPYAINLIQINMDNFHNLLNTSEKSYFSGKYNIGFWAWELENFPPNFQNYIDFLDEIWVPSNFCLNAISQVSTKPVLRFMHSIDIPKNDLPRDYFNLPEDKIIFLTMFDYHSTIQRKNPYATIEAFEKSFGINSTEAILVIKTSIGTEFKEEKSKLKKRIRDNLSIVLIEDILPRETLYGLMNICDIYVSLHRSEGFGLTMAEAMFLGKPVIATGYSANIEFMKNDNSMLVPYSMIPTKEDYYFPGLENEWANADIDKASEMMKLLAEKPEIRKSLGQKAQDYVKTSLAPSTIGLKIKNRIEYIYKYCIPNLNNDQQPLITNLKHENAVLGAKLIALRKIKAVQWKLAFKNFQNKISGNTKKYIWED